MTQMSVRITPSPGPLFCHNSPPISNEIIPAAMRCAAEFPGSSLKSHSIFFSASCCFDPCFDPSRKDQGGAYYDLLQNFLFSSLAGWNAQMHFSDQAAPTTRKLSKSRGKAIAATLAVVDAEVEARLSRTAQVDKFMRDVKWVHNFLPTLTQELYTSSSPFAHFGKQSPQFLQTVQEVFNFAFPTVTFSLRPNDKIVTEACKRMRTRRSLIARRILDHVQENFSREPYRDNPKLIRGFAVSALLPDGAAYYATPREEGNGNGVSH